MRNFIKENTWSNMMPTGWGNGYVVIPEDHPLHGKHYDSINVDVNGGLTFSELADNIEGWKEILPEDKGAWVVGFDTAHYNDNIKKWPKEAVQKETDSLQSQLENYKEPAKDSFTRKDVIDIINELLQYPDQLTDAIANENTDWFGENLLQMVEDKKD